MTDADYMARALFHAARGIGRTSPNPVVGAIIVSPEDVVVGLGYHARAGEPHAEVHALTMAGERARGATLYCSLEPCCHTGRTGPCVERIADAGIARVVAAVEDPNPLVHGRGFSYLRSRGIDVQVGVLKDEAIRLNQPFFTLMTESRPFVILKAAISLDGYLAESPGRPTPLTSEEANRHNHRMRAAVDAIAVGIGTVLADDPALTARGAYRESPLTRVIFDRRLRTPPTAGLFSTRSVGPVIIITTPEGRADATASERLTAAGAEVLVADGTIRGGLGVLGARQISSVLLEGGAGIHRAAWREGVIDFVRVYVTPHVIGAGGVPFLDGQPLSSLSLDDVRIEPLGPDVLMEGYVHRSR
ncbi:MAG: bifunctional diaminohydroxyphosphoribosylaminopyrimidine deaminase/5-amino-6-(5-phosphoribosylamino)uracil reductase RibD [Vicinamibacterales bacterium]